MRLEYTAKEIAATMGISERAIRQRAANGKWTHNFEVVRGGKVKKYPVEKLPADIQKTIVEKSDGVSMALIPTLAPEASIAAAMKFETGNLKLENRNVSGTWTGETAISETVLRDPRVRRIARIVQEALDVPRGWKKSKWIKAVAMKNDADRATLYKWIKRYEKRGLAGFAHTKKNRGRPKVWTPEAIDFWVGLCLKKEHRKIDKIELYAALIVEAHKRGWRIGGYESAIGWYKKKANPQLLALQRGGVRALDNTLPPVLRSYADLDPFEILVGDQHRFDFWVTDDDTGEVFRPEGYFWQDLRTRCFFGGALDRRYDAHLCGLALRMGCRIFGAFGSIYTDNGKPELSRYITGILAEMRALSMGWDRTVDGSLDTSDDAEILNPCVLMPGTHRKAIVKNAKAKMIEGTFNVFEGILRSHFKVAGYCRRLTDSGEDQDIDQKEMEGLAASGKLLTFTEFYLTLLKAMDYYNKEKAHRGVIREWSWKPKPQKATPRECLAACCADGWQPRWISPEAIDLVFLTRVHGGRMVDRGRILYKNTVYEHDDLVDLHGTRVDVRFDPMDPEWVLVFNGGEFICRAEPVEYSSMKNTDLAARKIEEKRRLRKAFLTQYREMTSLAPDIRNYSEIPLEESAAQIRKAQSAERMANQSLSAEQLAAEVALIENYHYEGRPVFGSEVDRYQYCLDQVAAGAQLIEEDLAFAKEYEAGMTAETREYWDTYRGIAQEEMPKIQNA